ncbi:hypothetical protein OQA88_8120 [Cercophora sp. LCS_1]
MSNDDDYYDGGYDDCDDQYDDGDDGGDADSYKDNNDGGDDDDQDDGNLDVVTHGDDGHYDDSRIYAGSRDSRYTSDESYHHQQVNCYSRGGPLRPSEHHPNEP